MNDKQKDFLDYYMDYIQQNYPRRYMQGVMKYKSVLTENYTDKELVDNALEELQDGIAYLLAVKYRMGKRGE